MARLGSNPKPSVPTLQCFVAKAIIYRKDMPLRKKPKKIKPTIPEKDVVEIQDSRHSEKDFLRDLGKASMKKPDDPSLRDQVSRRT
jgi:hypothetical protein